VCDLVEAFARSKGVNTLSIWAIQRDNGGCPGNGGANDCSGIVQNPWDFSHALEAIHRIRPVAIGW
jgi:hypothetical protein